MAATIGPSAMALRTRFAQNKASIPQTIAVLTMTMLFVIRASELSTNEWPAGATALPQAQDFQSNSYCNRTPGQRELPLGYLQCQQQQADGGSKRGERHGELDRLDPRIYEGRSWNKECHCGEDWHSQQERPAQPRKQRVVPIQFAEEFPDV